MARIKYCDKSVTPHVWRYADIVPNTSLPDGTSEGDILVWDDTNDEWVVGQETKELPEVSSTENGKVLVVASGEWDVGTIDLSSKITDPVTKSGGQVLTYDGTNHVWKAADASGGASIYISDSAPASPTNGMLWIDTDDTTYDIPDGDNGSY